MCLCVFVVGCGSSALNEEIVRFRCGGRGGKLYTILHIFL